MKPAHRVTQFRESVIRDMTRLALRHEAINLSQGFPDFATADVILETAVSAIRNGLNQYTLTWGYPPLLEKLAAMYTERLGWDVSPERHVTVTCGVSEGIVAAAMAALNPGDEMIVLEPAHDNFRPAAYMANAKPVPVPLEAPDYRLDGDRLRAAVTPNTRALLLNTPHNPTGRVFDEEEMTAVTDVVLENDLVLITDEIYDRILYDGRQHISPGSRDGLRERTITIGGLGKTYAITGWRLGYVIAPDPLAQGVRQIHDYTTICAPTPLQAAALAALDLPERYYAESLRAYHGRRALMMAILRDVGFAAREPEGAYYVMADYTGLNAPQAQLKPMPFAQWLTSEVGVAVVPGDSFYSLPGYGVGIVRFAFPKKLATLEAAGERLRAKLA
ncbi:MAG TPA: aminotransferase class I/II-fold pyridoxal phosphate-dependent enzyme [Anaerolineae bacterium]|nr:aminotransferase class I/II-fold pyridoxal phosphate-dependent enzyme [Anaerolineae bacterium]